MTATVDYATDLGKVRLLIADTDVNNAIFQDVAIQAFIDMATDGHVKRAAADALQAIAANESFVQKRIQVLDLKTDGPAAAKELRALAEAYRTQATEDEAADAGGAFDTIEMVYGPASRNERLFKQIQRGS